jgi:hypothetical protein
MRNLENLNRISSTEYVHGVLARFNEGIVNLGLSSKNPNYTDSQMLQIWQSKTSLYTKYLGTFKTAAVTESNVFKIGTRLQYDGEQFVAIDLGDLPEFGGEAYRGNIIILASTSCGNWIYDQFVKAPVQPQQQQMITFNTEAPGNTTNTIRLQPEATTTANPSVPITNTVNPGPTTVNSNNTTYVTPEDQGEKTARMQNAEMFWLMLLSRYMDHQEYNRYMMSQDGWLYGMRNNQYYPIQQYNNWNYGQQECYRGNNGCWTYGPRGCNRPRTTTPYTPSRPVLAGGPGTVPVNGYNGTAGGVPTNNLFMANPSGYSGQYGNGSYYYPAAQQYANYGYANQYSTGGNQYTTGSVTNGQQMYRSPANTYAY